MNKMKTDVKNEVSKKQLQSKDVTAAMPLMICLVPLFSPQIVISFVFSVVACGTKGIVTMIMMPFTVTQAINEADLEDAANEYHSTPYLKAA